MIDGNRASLLLVEDDDSFRDALSEVLVARGYDVTTAADVATAMEAVQSRNIDLVVTDLVMPGVRGDALLERLGSTFPEIPVVVVTAFGSVENALELTRSGAADYLTKPFRTRMLVESIERLLEESRPWREQARRRRDIGRYLDGIVGDSRPMVRLFERIGRVAPSPAPLLVTGETGVGKELVARAVHRASGRGPFVALNCSALPEQLVESEVFGHVRGSFTGAHRDAEGLFEAADGGTLFLDEIADLPPRLQPKLLRAIETGEIRRVGEVDSRAVDIRVIAATNRDLSALVDAGEFREDLYWRLNVLQVDVPPLRERRADIPILVEWFLARKGPRSPRGSARMSPSALEVLAEHSWPGNVRQLFGVVEHALTLADEGEIRPEMLPADILTSARIGELVRDGLGREATLAELEREYIYATLARVNGNKTEAARVLGIPRRTLYRRLATYSGVCTD